MFRHVVYVLTLLVLFSLANNVSAYASWLQCFVGLETDEVVMNHRIVPFEDADHEVKIEIEANDGGDWLQPRDFTYSDNETIKLRLMVPPELKNENVQYVMETTEGGVFSPDTMCDGKRAFARQYNDPVTLELSGEQNAVQIWAGWATGHEAVRLTEKVTLWKKVQQEEL